MKKELLKKFRVGIWGSVILVLFVTGVVLWWMLHGLFTEPTILTDLGKTLIEGEISANECTWLVFMVVLPACAVIQLLGAIIAMMAVGEKFEVTKSEKSTKKRKTRKKAKKEE